MKDLSILIVGFDKHIIQKSMEWNELNKIDLVGVLDPECANEAPDIPLITKRDLLNISHKIHVLVFAVKQNKIVQEFLEVKREDSLIIDRNTFWVLENMVEYRSKIQNLSTDQKLFQTILMYSHEGIQFVDEEGIIRYINPAFSRITNIPSEERIGKHIKDVSPEGALYRALKTETPVIGYKSTGLGSNVETISNAAPIFVEGKLVGALTTFQDITEVKYLTQKLMEKEQELYTDRLEESEKNQSQYGLADIIGESEAIRKTKAIAKKAARTRSTVLINSESGTGKELFAHAIHSESDFYQKPFVIVNCAAIPESLLESELFGYEKGAFTHATKQKIGKIESADEGTLFLDEIGDMSLSLQAKLLRVLQYKEFERIGGLKKIKVNIRIIAATNCDLKKLVKEGKFREDLYYRLNVIQIEIPPLRKRIEDIPFLVKRLMNKIALRINLNPMELTNKGIAILSDYHWPGNIRELENFLERIMNESTTSVIPDSLVYEHIQRILNDNPNKQNELQRHNLTPPTLPLRTIERDYIKRALDFYGCTLEGKKKAALSLGISISTLYNKIRSYKLE